VKETHDPSSLTYVVFEITVLPRVNRIISFLKKWTVILLQILQEWKKPLYRGMWPECLLQVPGHDLMIIVTHIE
jgi:hypothetical protein